MKTFRGGTDVKFRDYFEGSQKFANRNAENRIRIGTWKELSYWLMQSTLLDTRY